VKVKVRGRGTGARLTRGAEIVSRRGKEAPMALPTQIEERLRSLGVCAEDLEEKFVRGAGPGGQKIKTFKLIPTVLLFHPIRTQ